MSHRRGPGRAYVALADALAAGTLLVDEMSDGAVVPNVLVENAGALSALILFGEEIGGARRGRIANATSLVAPGARAMIDVSCVERGRCRHLEGRGARGDHCFASLALRRKMAAAVAAARARSGRFRTDQSQVWDEVDERLRAARVRSTAAAYADYVESREAALAELARSFALLERQVGFVAALGDEILGLEVIGRPEVFARAFGGLLRSWAVDAVEGAPATAPPPESFGPEPHAFLEALGATGASAPSLGPGVDLRLEAPALSGCGLLAGDLVHLVAFAVREG